MKKMFLFTLLTAALSLGFSQTTAAAEVQGEASQGTVSLVLRAGRVGTVDLGTSQLWSLQGNNNPGFAEVSISGNILTVKAIKPGFATVRACDSQSGDCINVSVTLRSAGSSTNNNVLGASILPNGSLVLEGQTVAAVYKNTKISFANYSSFKDLGYGDKQIITASADLPDSGYLVTTGKTAHPWGSWVIKDKTVYFVHELGLIPAADWQTFVSNGGNAELIISANSYDLQLPVLSLLKQEDPRLQ